MLMQCLFFQRIFAKRLECHRFAVNSHRLTVNNPLSQGIEHMRLDSVQLVLPSTPIRTRGLSKDTAYSGADSPNLLEANLMEVLTPTHGFRLLALSH